MRLALPADRARVIETVAQAFAASLEINFFFGPHYATLAPLFAGQLFDKRVGTRPIWAGEGGDACALWDFEPADAAADTGFAPSADSEIFPADVEERMARYDKLVHGMISKGPLAYLGILACRPDDVTAAGTGSKRFRRGLGPAGAASTSPHLWPAQLDFTVRGIMSDPRRSGCTSEIRRRRRFFRQLSDFLTLCVRRARRQTTAAAAGGAIFGDLYGAPPYEYLYRAPA